MLSIRLTRTGKKGQPSYRVIVVERRSKRDGKSVATLGFYNPLSQPATIKIDQAQYQAWIAKGAQPSATVRALAKKA